MLTLPTITLHGTHPRSLVDDYCTAMSAIIAAEAVLREKAHPNARDYPGDTLVAAQAEHAARLLCLQGIRAELKTLATFASDHPRAQG
jgi:hypothetical protein